MDAEKWGAFIVTRRKELDMTQADLAEQLHVTDKAVSRWERGVGLLDINLIEPIATALQLEISEVMRAERQVDVLKQEEVSDMISNTIEIANRRQVRFRKLFFVSHIVMAPVFFLLLLTTISQETVGKAAIIYFIVSVVLVYREGKLTGRKHISLYIWMVGIFTLIAAMVVPLTIFEPYTYTRPMGFATLYVCPALGVISTFFAIAEEDFIMIPLNLILIFSFFLYWIVGYTLLGP